MTPPPAVCELSVVVPIYRGADLVDRSVARLLEGIAPAVAEFEVILVDDGSGDGTANAIRRAAAESPRVRAIHLPSNQGKGAAVAAGMLAATGRVRAFTDADVPFGVAPILAMHKDIRTGASDASVGDRRLRGSAYYEGVPRFRRVASFAFAELVRLLAPCDALDTQCGLKAFDGDVAAHLFPVLRERGFAFDAELLFVLRKYGLKVARQPVQLLHSGPTTVSLTRVALPMLWSVAKLRPRWWAGGYAEDWLAARGAARVAARGR